MERGTAKRLLLVATACALVTSAGSAQSGPARGSHVGHASSRALASALDKQDAMRRPNGPKSVTLTPEEMASLVQFSMQPQAREALDSLGVSLEPGRITLHGYLVTASLGSEIFGPMAMMLDPREPLSVSGPARAAAPGLISWVPDTFMVRTYQLPQGAIPMLVRRLTGSADGTVAIAVPPTVTRIKIESGAMTFSRK